MSITQSQKEAISASPGPVMVLAGPGSGKTLVITHRARFLIRQLNIPPQNILVVTFSKAASAEMKSRWDSLMGEEGRGVIFGTFHAVFFHILKAAYHFSVESILRDDEKKAILHNLCAKHLSADSFDSSVITQLEGEISIVKCGSIKLENYYSSVCAGDAFRKICEGYLDTLRKRGKVDYDDMLCMTFDLLSERPDILAFWQKRFTHILVDEFQDINALQYRIVKLLLGQHGSLFAVGDDDQSIYAFRGANPSIMLNFAKDNPGAQIICLRENFRSLPAITEAAGRVIAGNRERFEKNICCVREGTEPVEIRAFAGARQEALCIASQIMDKMKREGSAAGTAILTRTQAGVRYFAFVLRQYNIPVKVADSVPDLYSHWVCQDIFAYFRLAGSAGVPEGRADGSGGDTDRAGRFKSFVMDRADLLMVMNRPLRYLRRDALRSKKVAFEDLLSYYEGQEWMQKRIITLRQDLEMIASLRPFAAVNYIRKAVGYEAYLEKYAEEHGIDTGQLIDILDELQESAEAFETPIEWAKEIIRQRKEREKNREKAGEKGRGNARGEDSYGNSAHGNVRGENVSGNSDRGEGAYGGDAERAVVLSTLHASKGLEFSEVFLPDLNETIIPHRRSVREHEIEEERRLLYVGMTRAKDRLHLYYLKERCGKEMKVSRFLGDLVQGRK